MFMAPFRVKYANQLYYSDTDSLILNCQLPNEVVGPELGKFKLEYEAKEGIFLAPKVYSLLLDDNSEITKIKGSKLKISFNEIKNLLIKDSVININQEK
jgi:hypothetical protein